MQVLDSKRQSEKNMQPGQYDSSVSVLIDR